MAYSKSPRPHRRYSVLVVRGLQTTLYPGVRAHNGEHAKKLAVNRWFRTWGGRRPTLADCVAFEGTVRIATS